MEGLERIRYRHDNALRGQEYLEHPSKRRVDIATLAALGPFAGVIMAVSAGLIKLGETGPAFIDVDRIGIEAQGYKMKKLRTMEEGEQYKAMELKREDDERVTRVGRLLRRYSVDEIP